ncbi:MAG: flagellin N-terminal helical domain-containing protein [Burkholderiales bacterium]
MINPPSLNNLNNAQNSQLTAFQRLSSGSRINSAKDDPAGLAIAVAMVSQMGGDQQAIKNVNDGLSLTNTAGGALSQASDTIQRIRELTVQAANGTNSASDLQAIQGEISQLSQGLNQIASDTQFNGQTLLDGTFNGQVQSGGNPGETSPLNLGDVSSQGLGISNIDVTTQSGATSALNALDGALNTITTQQAGIGAAQAGLNSTLANLSNTYENLAAAKSRISDTNYTQESTSQAQANVQTQASLQALALYNSAQSNVLGLIKT